MENKILRKDQKTTSKKNNMGFFKPFIQKKLNVGSASNPYEVEADRVADKVMKMSEPSSHNTQTGALVQRKCAHCEQEEKLQMKPLAESISPFIQRSSSESGGVASDHVESQINSSRGGGSIMDSATKNFMESRFGADFSDVKIHTGNEAVQMSRELGAQAFAVGNDIYFNEGKYNPDSQVGKHLLAHELTHTVQQSNGVRRQIQRVTGVEESVSIGTVLLWCLSGAAVSILLDQISQSGRWLVDRYVTGSWHIRQNWCRTFFSALFGCVFGVVGTVIARQIFQEVFTLTMGQVVRWIQQQLIRSTVTNGMGRVGAAIASLGCNGERLDINPPT